MRILKLILILFLVPFFYLLYKIYIPRVNAFGCFDDCFNFMGGYFLLAGKHIFSDFFYNHQPFASYISYFVQGLTHPINVFELVLRHRQFVMIFAFLFNILLIWRFGLAAFLFTLIYELSKFYLFGDRFLAEGMIVYPLVYLAGIVILKFSSFKQFPFSNQLFTIDYILAAVFAWFVVFMREPYVLLALVLFGLILSSFRLGFKRTEVFALILFISLSIVTLLSLNIKEYFFNVVTVNYQTHLRLEAKADMVDSFAQTFFYPLYILVLGKWNIFRQLLIFIDIVFLANFFMLVRRRAYKTSTVIFIILGLANIRVVLPGYLFYEAFHMIVWYALFIFITLMLVFWNFKQRWLFYFSIILLSFALLSFVSSKSYFPRENFDQHSELLTNYGEVMQIGEVVRALSKPEDTLFLDASDDLIYWQAKKLSPYKYSWYTSSMPYFKKYTDARLEMFKNNPPDFYKEYGSCPKKVDLGELYRLPDFVKDKYVRLYNLENPSCLFVRKEKIKEISDKQWEKAAESLYSLEKLKR